MVCDSFGKCGSCILHDIPYDEQIFIKKKRIKEEFFSFCQTDIEVFSSKKSHFRNRAEFRVWHEGDKIFYAMNGFSKKDIVKIDECLIVEEEIYQKMKKILDSVKKSTILKKKLFSIEFLSGEELLVTLIYHKKIDEVWLKEAIKLEKKLGVFVIGRSRGIRIIVSKNYIFQDLNVLDKMYKYKVYENSFLQPNTKVNEKMISWVKKYSKGFVGDLLELYCGHGNFTIPLSENFDKVLATEISKKSIKSAKENCELNRVSNIFFARLSTEELVKALNKERVFKRLVDINLEDYNFSTVFVDPPRVGIDAKSLEFISKFKNIIYISCNPQTLKRDLNILCKTHKVEKFAIFDQFAYTNHLECGVVLKKVAKTLSLC